LKHTEISTFHRVKSSPHAENRRIKSLDLFTVDIDRHQAGRVLNNLVIPCTLVHFIYGRLLDATSSSKLPRLDKTLNKTKRLRKKLSQAGRHRINHGCDWWQYKRKTEEVVRQETCRTLKAHKSLRVLISLKSVTRSHEEAL
jgi:hypothetical protein